MTSVEQQQPFSAGSVFSFISYTLILSIFFKWLISRRKLYALSWSLPGPIGLPFFGNICPRIQSVPRVLKRLEDESKKYSSPYRLWYGTKLIIVFTDPEQIKSVLTECYIPGKPGMYYYWALGIGTGLLTGHGGITWRRNRLLMNTAFDNFSITQYQRVVNKQTKKMVSKIMKLVGQGAQDIDLNSQRMCFDVISEGLLKEQNAKFQEDNADQIMNTFPNVNTICQRKATTCWLRCEHVFEYTDDYTKLENSKNSLRTLAKDIYKRRKEEFFIAKSLAKGIIEEEQVLKTPIDIMLEAQYTGNRPFDEEVIDEILNIYQAGTGPTSACLSFFILMLAMHRDIQERLYNEISAFYQKKKTDEINIEDLSQFKYLEMCLKEVMRMFPGNAFLAREVTEDTQMDDGLFLPAGVKIFIPSYMLNMSPDYWKDPKTFNPERFNPDLNRERNPYLFLPFGAGPRNCIGQQLGTNIVKTAIIHLLNKFRFHSEKTLNDVSLFVEMVTIKPESGYPVQIFLRD